MAPKSCAAWGPVHIASQSWSLHVFCLFFFLVTLLNLTLNSNINFGTTLGFLTQTKMTVEQIKVNIKPENKEIKMPETLSLN